MAELPGKYGETTARNESGTGERSRKEAQSPKPKAPPDESPSDISSDTSNDPYRTSFENVKVLAKLQAKEIQSLLIRIRGFETLSQISTEREKEYEALRSKNLKLEGAISTLQSRLATHGLSTCASFEDSDLLVSGVNKDLMTDLIKENALLKQGMKYATVDPTRMGELLKEVQELKERIKVNQLLISKLEYTKGELENALRASPSEKDSHILLLRNRVQELEQKGKTTDLLCQSLSVESAGLKQRLQETAEMCQQLANQLGKDKTPGGASISRSVSQTRGASSGQQSLPVSVNEETKLLRREYSSLQTDYIAVCQQLHEAKETNARWQKFSDQREEYVKQILKENQELKKRCQGPASPLLTEDQQRQMDDLLMSAKTRNNELQTEKEKVDDENRQLRLKVQSQANLIERMRAQITTQVEPTGPVQEYKERIQMLEHQVRVCAEDFETERKDRERAQAKTAEVERELLLLRKQLDRQQASPMNRLYQERMSANRQYNYPKGQVGMAFGQGDLLARGTSQRTYPHYATDGSVDEGVVDVRENEPEGSQESEELLQCPRCLASFPSDRHNELLEHMDKCCD